MQSGERSKQAMRDEADLPFVDRVLSGDQRALKALVRRHERRVFRVTVAILGIPRTPQAMQDRFHAPICPVVFDTTGQMLSMVSEAGIRTWP